MLLVNNFSGVISFILIIISLSRLTKTYDESNKYIILNITNNCEEKYVLYLLSFKNNTCEIKKNCRRIYNNYIRCNKVCESLETDIEFWWIIIGSSIMIFILILVLPICWKNHVKKFNSIQENCHKRRFPGPHHPAKAYR
jgi:hypothetical protein